MSDFLSWSRIPSVSLFTDSNESEIWILGIPLMTWAVKSKQKKHYLCISCPSPSDSKPFEDKNRGVYSIAQVFFAWSGYSIYIHWCDLNLQEETYFNQNQQSTQKCHHSLRLQNEKRHDYPGKETWVLGKLALFWLWAPTHCSLDNELELSCWWGVAHELSPTIPECGLEQRITSV